MAGHERELDTAADHSYHHFHLVKSKILSDAVLITSRERHVGIRVSALSMDRVEMRGLNSSGFSHTWGLR